MAAEKESSNGNNGIEGGKGLNNLLTTAFSNVLVQLFHNPLIKTIDPSKATPFDARRPPTILIQSYFERIVKYASCSSKSYMIAYIYLNRILKKHPTFIFSDYNAHRLLITSVLMAVKYHEDFYFTNTYYARIGGVGVKELNLLEVEFLLLLDFDLRVEAEEFQAYISLFLQQIEIVNRDQVLSILTSDTSLTPDMQQSAVYSTFGVAS